MDYSIHRILEIRTNVNIPIPEHFRVGVTSRTPDLTVSSKKCLEFRKPRDNKILKGNYYFWANKNKMFIDYSFMNAKLSIEDLLGSTKVECTNSLKRFCTRENWEKLIFAILSVKLIQKGYTFIHSGCLSHREQGILIPAVPDTGKTSTVLSLLDGKEFRFMGDDLVIIGKNGMVYSYPKEVRVSPRTLTGGVIPLQHTLKERMFKFRIFSTLMERFIKEDITKLQRIPREFIEDKCPLGKIFLLGGYGDERVRKISKERAVRAVSTLSAQVPNLLETYLDMYYHLFDVDITDLIVKKTRIIKSAFKNVDCFVVTAPVLQGFSKMIAQVTKNG